MAMKKGGKKGDEGGGAGHGGTWIVDDGDDPMLLDSAVVPMLEDDLGTASTTANAAMATTLPSSSSLSSTTTATIDSFLNLGAMGGSPEDSFGGTHIGSPMLDSTVMAGGESGAGAGGSPHGTLLASGDGSFGLDARLDDRCRVALEKIRRVLPSSLPSTSSWDYVGVHDILEQGEPCFENIH